MYGVQHRKNPQDTWQSRFLWRREVGNNARVTNGSAGAWNQSTPHHRCDFVKW